MFSLVGWITMLVTRPLTAWLTAVVCPLGIGDGPSGVQACSRLAGSRELDACGPVGPTKFGSGIPALCAACLNCCSRARAAEIAPFLREGEYSLSMRPR